MKIVITVKDTDNVIGLKEDIAMRLEGVADIVRIDTADVVPRSEVDRVYYNLKAVLEERAESKQEVAREIFDEILKILDEYSEYFHEAGHIYDEVAELKKKYTEEKK